MRVADLLEDAAMFEFRAKRAVKENRGTDEQVEGMTEAIEAIVAPQEDGRFLCVKITLRFAFESGCGAEAAAFAEAIVDNADAMHRVNRYTLDEDDYKPGAEDLGLEAWCDDHILGEINLLSPAGTDFAQSARSLTSKTAAINNSER